MTVSRISLFRFAFIATIVPLIMGSVNAGKEPSQFLVSPNAGLPPLAIQLVQTSRDRWSLYDTPLPEEHLERQYAASVVRYVSSHPDLSSYRLLFLLRRDFPNEFQALSQDLKAQILCSALAHLGDMNDFAYLSPSASVDRLAGHVLRETGPPAIFYLRKLLDDNDIAQLSGSEEALASDVFKYRRADFAYRYLSLALGKAPVFPADVQQRDELISGIKAHMTVAN